MSFIDRLGIQREITQYLRIPFLHFQSSTPCSYCSLPGLVGGEYENPDRVFTGQVAGLLTGSSGLLGGGGGGLSSDIQYGFESSCPGGINQNTALLATAAAIGEMTDIIIKEF